MPEEEKRSYRNADNLTRWTIWFLYAQVAIGFIALISGWLEFQVLSGYRDGAYATEELAIAAGDASDARQGMVGLAQTIIYLISAFLILRWIHRANHNARALGAHDMTFTPGWSIGWYFIPIFNLWKPYQAMKEIWQASADPRAWTSQPVSALLPWWWLFWLVSNILSNASLRLTIRAEELDELVTANLVTELADLTGIPLCLLLVTIVRKVHVMQVMHAPPDAPS